MTKAQHPDDAARMLIRHDVRPFLVQVIDRAIVMERWVPGDAEAFTMAATSLALRYLAQRQWDPRDADAVRTATEIVLMYVSDGLDQWSDGDCDRAVEILDSRPIVECFRKGWPTMERLRHQIADASARAQVRWGPLVLDAFPFDVEDRLHAYGFGNWQVRDARRVVEKLTDEQLLGPFRDHGTIRSVREDLARVIGLLTENAVALAALPIGEVRTQWDAMFESVQTNGYLSACAGAVVRVVVRGDLGVTVRPEDLRVFVRAHVDGLAMRSGSDRLAVSRLSALLPAVAPTIIASAVAAVTATIHSDCGSY